MDLHKYLAGGEGEGGERLYIINKTGTAATRTNIVNILSSHCFIDRLTC
jgi:hypothetical protein